MEKIVLLQISESLNSMKCNLSKFDRYDVYIHLFSILVWVLFSLLLFSKPKHSRPFPSQNIGLLCYQGLDFISLPHPPSMSFLKSLKVSLASQCFLPMLSSRMLLPPEADQLEIIFSFSKEQMLLFTLQQPQFMFHANFRSLSQITVGTVLLFGLLFFLTAWEVWGQFVMSWLSKIF